MRYATAPEDWRRTIKRKVSGPNQLQRAKWCGDSVPEPCERVCRSPCNGHRVVALRCARLLFGAIIFEFQHQFALKGAQEQLVIFCFNMLLIHNLVDHTG